MRKKRKQWTVSIEEQNPDYDCCIGDMLADINDTEDEAVASDLKEWLLKKDQELISLRLQGLTQAQIGERIGISPQRVGAKLKKLKEAALCLR